MSSWQKYESCKTGGNKTVAIATKKHRDLLEWREWVSFGQMLRSGTAGSPGRFPFSFLWDFPTPISRVAAPICAPTDSEWASLFLHNPDSVHCFCWLEPFWVGYDEISIVLTWIALISKDDEPLSGCFLAILTSSPENAQFWSPAHFFSLPPVITGAGFIWLS